MKILIRSRLLQLFLFTAVFWVNSVSAQMFNNPTTAKVWYFVRGIADYPDPEVEMNFGGTYSSFEFDYLVGDWEQSPAATKVVNLAQEYTFSVTATDMVMYEFVFDAPPNMTIYLNGIATDTIADGSISSDEFTVTVLPNNNYEAREFGQSSGLSTGKMIWKLGLGKLSNGDPAGSVIISQEDIDANAYKPDGLVYTDQYDEVDVVLDGGVLRQVLARISHK